jgi:2-keto-myo-inositol isomerase
MLIAINGATTMKATLPEDIAAASAAGFKALEIWAAKMDAYLESHPVEELRALFDEAGLQPVSINSIEFITFRPPEEYEAIKARCRELCALAQALGCDKIVVVYLLNRLG